MLGPADTNIGADDRSQFDLFEAMPGGLAGVRAAVDELHAAGVKVLIPYNPWDSGTLRCGPGMATCGGDPSATADGAKGKCGGPATSAHPGTCDARIIDGLIKEMNADGFNGDTMGKVPEEFYTVSVHNNHSVAIEPEGGGGGVEAGVSTANWDTMGWVRSLWPQHAAARSLMQLHSGASLSRFALNRATGSIPVYRASTRGSGWTVAGVSMCHIYQRASSSPGHVKSCRIHLHWLQDDQRVRAMEPGPHQGHPGSLV